MKTNFQNSFQSKLLSSLLSKIIAITLICNIWIIAISSAQAESNTYQDQYLSIELISDDTQTLTEDNLLLGLKIKIEPGWHISWKNPGNVGLPTEIQWELPEYLTFDKEYWPTPEHFTYQSFSGYGYQGNVVVASSFKMVRNLNAAFPFTARVRIAWLLCSDECIPGEAILSKSFDLIPSASDQQDQDEVALLKTAVASAIQNLPSLKSDLVSYNDQLDLVIYKDNLVNTQISAARFLPFDSDSILNEGKQSFYTDDSHNLVISFSKLKSLIISKDLRAAGLLYVDKGEDKIQSIYRIESPSISSAISTKEPIDDSKQASFLVALLSAFLGGLLLNLMPCVFPVLSIKILGFVSHNHKQSALSHGLAFGLGVLLSFWILAFALIILRSLGAQLGWGFQFQSPTFVASIGFIVFAIALNLSGLFELGSSLQNMAGKVQTSNNYSGSFLSGVLATVLATPCTAPFMGAALAAALSMPVILAFFVFTALGIGMALPYVFLTSRPSLLRFLPRPGNWMNTFKELMAFPLFATVTWLCWVLGLQTGVKGIALYLLGLLFVATGLWTLGKWCVPSSSRLSRKLSSLSCCGFVSLGLFIGLPFNIDQIPDTNTSTSTVLSQNVNWEAFSEERLNSLLKENRNVLIDFTAAWCLVCQVNHQMVHDSLDVIEQFKAKNVVLLRADWTSKNPSITNALSKFGTSGVPLNVLYKGKQEPLLFSSLISHDSFLEALKRL